MGQDKDLTNKRLTQLWKDNSVEVLDTAKKKYAIVSDLHMGDGGKADDFKRNKDTVMRALDLYKKNGFTLILLGDVEELWQFDMHQIEATYGKDIYGLIKAFGQKRVFRVFGNHDLDWQLRDPIKDVTSETGWAVEALKMKDKSGQSRIMLVHGHQGSTESDKRSWISRIFVRRIWKPLEPLATKLGLYGHPEATKSQVAKDYERILYQWAKKTKVILICGHSHRAIFASRTYIDKLKEEIREIQSDILAHRSDKQRVKRNIKKIEKLDAQVRDEMLKARSVDAIERSGKAKPCYFNSGCGLYKDGITTLEIEDDVIRLVKWHRRPKKGEPLFEVYDDGGGKTLSDFSKEVAA